MSALRCYYCGCRVRPENKSPTSNHYKGHIFCDGLCGNSWWIMKERLWDGIHLPKWRKSN